MKLNPQEIRAAMDSRLSFLTESSARRARIRNKIVHTRNPVPTQRKAAWISLTAVMALIVAGVALTTGLHPFGMFGNQDARNGEDAQTPLFSQVSSNVGDGDRTVNVMITYAHYDGDSLTIAYTIENGTRWEPFTPTQEQLTEMKKIEGGIDSILFTDENDPLLFQMEEAMENGTTAGLTCYSTVADKRTEVNGGINLGHAGRTGGEFNDGIEYSFRQYTALGMDDEGLDVTIHLWHSAQSFYFDGTELFVLNFSPIMDGTMKAKIPRTEEPVAAAYARHIPATDLVTQHMSGTRTTYEGAVVTAAAEVSAEFGEITLTASGEGFAVPDAATWTRMTQKAGAEYSEPIDDYWYRIAIRDADGNLLQSDSCVLVDAHTISATFEGNGSLPERLSVSLLLCSWNSGVDVMAPLVLSADPAPDAWATITWREFPPGLSTISPDDNVQPQGGMLGVSPLRLRQGRCPRPIIKRPRSARSQPVEKARSALSAAQAF